VRQQWHERIPQARYGTTREIANAVAFLVSDEASYINGQTLAVDGGFSTAGLMDRE
jgi:NAD(P)-dependent dehydrogenase (short-subunit alcohol dehydrogenase family)